MRFSDRVSDRVRALDDAGLRRALPTVPATGLSFASNDYLGLAHARSTVSDAPAGAGASRLLGGTHAAHVRAEQALAGFVHQPHALLFSSGYAANVGAVSALATRDDVVFSDALNHASLIDGCRLARARTVVYPHLDLDALRAGLREHRARGVGALIVTESLFSMEGDVAPLAALRRLADEYDAGLLVDEAHALGVLGPAGHGALVASDVRADVVVGTLGKAFGLSGAFVAADRGVCELLANVARSFVFSTAPGPALAAAVQEACDRVVRADPERARLHGHAARVRGALAAMGRSTPGSPIVPILVGAPEAAVRLSARLREHGVWIPAIRPPTVPVGTSRLRMSLSAAHTTDEVERACRALELTLAS